jgi:menaquinone-dependent protoporphyrinogen oxidase
LKFLAGIDKIVLSIFLNYSNMKTLIIYSSRHGTTEKIAVLISEKLESLEVTLINLKFKAKIELHNFDRVIIGGSIHMGQIQKSIKDFINKYQHELLQKQLGLFICCMNEEKAEEEFRLAFPEKLRNHALATGIMGGELLLEKMNFLERFIVKTVSGQKETASKINFPAIDKFAEAINEGVKVRQNLFTH